MEAYQAELVASGRYKIHTIHVKIRSVRRFYEHLEKAGYVLVNPAAGFALPKLGRRLPAVILTMDEVRRLLSAPDTRRATGVRDRAILETFYSTGIRVGELCALDIADIDFHGGVLRINSGKGAKDRIVPFGKTAADALTAYMQRARGELMRPRTDHGKLFVSRMGQPLRKTGVELIVKNLSRKAGIQKAVTPHTLRHTFATHMIAAGADISHVQRLLGHSCITTTQIYLRVVQKDVKEMHERCHPAEKDDLPSLPAEPARFSTAIAHCEVSHE